MKYILYGAAKYMRDNIDEDKIRYFDYIVDNDPKKIGTMYLGKEIKSSESLLNEDKENIFIIITAFESLYCIEYDLKQMGFQKGLNFEWIGRLYNHYPKHSLWIHKRSDNWKKDETAWREYTPNDAPPHERAVLVSKMIEWGNVKSVLDLGAGSEPMRPLLPNGVIYYPVDYKQLTGNTLVYDFNKKEFPDIEADVVIIVGVHGYVDYEVWLIDKAVNSVNPGGQLIISMNYFTGNYNAFDLTIKYHNSLYLIDYAFRNKEYGIFKFRRK